MENDDRMLALVDVAASQWGLFTTNQAGAVGVPAQRLARAATTGAIERIRHGVYRMAGSPSVDNEELRAAWLAIDPAVTAWERLDSGTVAVVSHRSAARLLNLGDLDADIMEFSLPHRKQSRLADLRYHRGTLGRSEWTVVDGLPVTTAARTVLDLTRAHCDGGHLAGIARDALASGLADHGQLSRALQESAHRYGAPPGDGAALLDQFIALSGVPESAVALASVQAEVLGRKLADAFTESLRARLGRNADAVLQAAAVRMLAPGATADTTDAPALQPTLGAIEDDMSQMVSLRFADLPSVSAPAKHVGDSNEAEQ
ncbi:type IV toxin-antitoxin system AbiEi family antitoxin domain-containing protein [Rhodococcus sp. NCIMB 12038]|uniref:type IV toxin-antitoxin system AbiEi family antitoxin domain-containing protein n=1 Tax=Rhodococcus sp. NCIMB 12038 TaxID=933800 RepID=UPI000B5765B7|nr:type IV toxin-antitoxin system AbiEi family antitoxin domain-containing protein [Rhodococcus sp. NCIMB 12038]OUS91924.1 hypothetical protein CA951_31120 [Rhodococcus sp. NCIMB 12038]